MEQEYEKLIIGYLDNRLEKNDIEKFFTWIEEDGENKKLFFEIAALYETMRPASLIDIEKSWQSLLGKHEVQYGKKVLSPAHIRISLWKYIAVAAIAVFVTSSFFLYFMAGNRNQERQSVRYISGNGLKTNIMVLPDGTRVQLGSSSKIVYYTDYGKKDREVYLEGEAFFDIAKQKDKPFIVKLGEQDITALGTQFYVMSYPADSVIITTLIEGSILFSTRQDMEQVLIPDQQLIYYKTNHSITVTDNVNSDDIKSWTAGYYHFNQETLENILHKMGNVLGVQFFILSDNLKLKRFSGTFYLGQNSRDIMEIIKLSIPVSYKIEDGIVTITE